MKQKMEIKVSNGSITKANAIVTSGGTCRLEFEIVKKSKKVKEELEGKIICPKELLVLIEASKLSMDDKIMKYRPKTDEEKKFKRLLTEVIKSGVEDFYCPKLAPSFVDENKTAIHYVAGEKPAVGKSWNWWDELIKDTEWCWGSNYQYAAFLGVLMKKLVESGWSVTRVWNAVCNDSKELGHYCNSENAKHAFEVTGSRDICDFFDLANAYKILAKDEEAGGFGLAGGYYFDNSNNFPLADLAHDDNFDCGRNNSVPWFVLKKRSTDH